MLAPRLTPPVCVTCSAPMPLDSAEYRADVWLRRVADLAPADGPVIALLNEVPLLRADWGRRLVPGDRLVFVRLPQGGGGGDSDPLRVVLQIVVLVVAVATQQYYIAQGAFFTGAAAGAAVALAGNVLVNAIAPLPKPSAGRLAGQVSQQSPTYAASVSLAGNAARLGQPVPVIYGRHIVLPDFFQRPYYTYDINGVQTYHALFVVGAGEYDLESLSIDDTPFNTFPGVPQSEIFLGEDGSTLVPRTPVPVTEVGGIELDSTETSPWFIVSNVGQTVDRLQWDIVLPRGLYTAEDDGTLTARDLAVAFELQAVDNDNNPGGSIVTLIDTYAGSSTSPIRRSYESNVAVGRYRMRVRRITPFADNARVGNSLVWSAAYGYLDNQPQFIPGVTYLAVRMQATNSLNQQTARRVRAVVQRRLPVYRNGVWTDPEPTRAVVWALLDAARNTLYGGALPDSRLDLDAFLNLNATLESRRDRFDGIFDTRQGLLSVMQQIARAGRAAVVPYLSQLTTVRDELQSLAVAKFSPRNIVPDTFALSFAIATGDTADGVTAVYFDQVSWAEKRLIVPAPGVVTPQRPAEVTFFGMVQPVQVEREARTIAAETFYRRRSVTFETELDGAGVRYGQLIAVAHDLVNGAHSADAANYVAGSRLLTLSEAMPETWQDGRTLYLVYTRRDGSPSQPVTVAATGDPFLLTVSEEIATGLARADNEERPRVVVYEAETTLDYARVLAIRPRGRNRVEVTGVIENNAVHEADNGLEVPEDQVGAPPVDDVISIDADANNVNLRDLYNATLGDPGTTPVSVEFRVESLVIVGSTSSANPAMQTGDWPAGSNLVLRNLSRIAGAGGGGAFTPAIGQGNGGGGGIGLQVDFALSLVNGAGSVWGGGGGGGTGGQLVDSEGGEPVFYPGGAGGGGAGRNPGGGGAGQNGAGDGEDGTETAGGAGGNGATRPQGNSGGRGGSGGAPGEPGQGGTDSTTTAGGAGGAAGVSIAGESLVVYVGSQGDIRGPVAA